MLSLAAAGAAQIQETIITNQLDSPVGMAIAPDGRIFVAEQAGALRVIVAGVLLVQPFVTVPTIADDEEGLIAVAVDPNFATNNYIYVNYTAVSPTNRQRISRFTANGNTALPGSEVVLFELDDNIGHYHVGAAMAFANDGTIYFGCGDTSDPSYVQSLGNTRGKLMRIGADGSIPASNPYYNTATGIHRAIVARGLRNPWSLAVQQSTGRIFIGDIGSNVWEEVNELVFGGDYGYPMHEGITGLPGLVDPIHLYDHSVSCASIVGCTFYEPATPHFPLQLQGKFLYADYCMGEIRYLDPQQPASHRVLHQCSVLGPVGLCVAPDGSLYYLARGNIAMSGGPNIPGGTVVHVTCNNCTILASAPSYGQGCAGQAGIPALAASAPPSIGSPNLSLDASNLLPGNAALLLLGTSNTASLLGPLPIDLTVFGMPSCFLWTSGDSALLALAGATGTASFPLPLPNNFSLLSARAYFQVFGSDAAANRAGFIGSNGLAVQVGN